MDAARLKKYEKQLLAMNERLESDVDELNRDIAATTEATGVPTSHTQDALETDLALEANEEAIQHDVRLALKRIEAGTYGKCSECDGQIRQPRLDALPYTQFCIDCERIREANG